MEQDAIGRIDVLRIIVAERPPAETDQVALRVVDGEHEAIAEAIVDPFLLQFALDAEACTEDFLSTKALFKKIFIRGGK